MVAPAAVRFAPPPPALSLFSSNTVVGELECSRPPANPTARSSLAELSPLFVSFSPGAFRAPAPGTFPPAPSASRRADMNLRTACCHNVRIDCFTSGNLTTSTTPTLIASIM